MLWVRHVQTVTRRHLSTTSFLLKNHYDTLQITPHATHSEIKDAYYKLSMIYHPDKTANDSTAHKMFCDITAAYEVLGNVQLRKLYDKGFSHIGMSEEVTNTFYKSRDRRTRPASTGRTPIYDFDEWSRQHYSSLTKLHQERKHRIEIHNVAVKNERQTVEMSRILVVLGAVLIMYMFSSGELRLLEKPPKLAEPTNNN
ncbi:hypothetical protein FQA39_LY16151 [Lamprigera yunnana]|nr:hypothetical protein FQA39_LY16151 [Lamprigera yunnana]